jgi:hypothetical protein
MKLLLAWNDFRNRGKVPSQLKGHRKAEGPTAGNCENWLQLLRKPLRTKKAPGFPGAFIFRVYQLFRLAGPFLLSGRLPFGGCLRGTCFALGFYLSLKAVVRPGRRRGLRLGGDASRGLTSEVLLARLDALMFGTLLAPLLDEAKVLLHHLHGGDRLEKPICVRTLNLPARTENIATPSWFAKRMSASRYR